VSAKGRHRTEGSPNAQINPKCEDIKLKAVIQKELVEETRDECHLRSEIQENRPTPHDIICLYYVNENNLGTSPQVDIKIAEGECIGLLETGC
jgi:hypothetical protein